jgi:E1A/CREB-binding protein
MYPFLCACFFSDLLLADTSGCAVQKNLGASLVETFTVAEIDQHITSTQQDMARCKPDKGAVPTPAGEACPVCNNSHTLRFEPPPKNCVTCGRRIKRDQVYYVHHKPDAVWCQQCFNSAGEDLHVETYSIKKAIVADKKFKNEQHEDEAWVNCDNPKCGKWVHMICGLFNKARLLVLLPDFGQSSQLVPGLLIMDSGLSNNGVFRAFSLVFLLFLGCGSSSSNLCGKCGSCQTV